MSQLLRTLQTKLDTIDASELENVRGVIFDIQRYSLHDGPGLRTNVFFKGCPLRCKWCCNPESQSEQPELALFQNRCFACGDCVEVCTPSALRLGRGLLQWEPKRCTGCGKCVEVCASNAIRWIGQQLTALEVVQEVMRDVPFYGEKGGLTLTGGEPTMQPDFAEAILRLAKTRCIHTTIETCGHAPWRVFERLLPYLDLVLYDIKHMDSQRHAQGTGVGNEVILENARRIAGTGIPMVIRVPLIPGFSTSEDNLLRTCKFALELGVHQIDLLPYHRLGQPKYKALGRVYPWRQFDLLEKETVERLADLVSAHGIQVQVEG